MHLFIIQKNALSCNFKSNKFYFCCRNLDYFKLILLYFYDFVQFRKTLILIQN